MVLTLCHSEQCEYWTLFYSRFTRIGPSGEGHSRDRGSLAGWSFNEFYWHGCQFITQRLQKQRVACLCFYNSNSLTYCCKFLLPREGWVVVSRGVGEQDGTPPPHCPGSVTTQLWCICEPALKFRTFRKQGSVQYGKVRFCLCCFSTADLNCSASK